MASALDTYTQGLAALKRRYSSTDQAGQADIAKEGIQLRQRAQGEGVDLNQLEDAANLSMNRNYNVAAAANDPYEKQYRSDLFGKVKTMAPVGELPTAIPSPPPMNPNYGKAEKNYDTAQKVIDKGYKYDPNSDPLVAGARENAGKRATLATNDMMEEMNSRGILNSTVTSDRASQIHLQSEDQVTAMLPQFAQMAQNNHQNEISNMFGLGDRFANLGVAENQYEMQKAALTGKYMDPQLKGLYDQTLQLKRIAENPNATKQQFDDAHRMANTLRDQIAQAGGNPDIVGSDYDASQASRNIGGAASMTLPAQQMMVNTLMGISGNYPSIPVGTSDQMGQYPAFSPLQGYVKGLEGVKTTQGRQLDAQAVKASNPSYTEIQNKSVIGMTNDIISRSQSKQDALERLTDPDVQKAIVNDGIDISSVKKAIEDYYGKDPKEAATLSPAEIASRAQQSASEDVDYLAADTREEQQAILDKWIQYWSGGQGK